MSTLSLTATFVNRWKTWGKHENRRTTPGVPTPKRWYVLAGLALLGVSFYAPIGWMIVSQYIQQHPYFAISDIDVELEPGALFSPEEIVAWSGVTRGMNLWTVASEQVSARLLAVPGIRDVEVRREFPQRVVFQVRSRHPLAVVAQPSVTYLDKDGVWFTAQTQKKELDLPYVTGFSKEALDTVAAGTALVGTVALLSLAAKLWADPLSEIRWDQKDGYTVFFARRHITVRLGWETAPEKFVQVATVLAQWPVDGPPALFDARFLGQVIVRPVLDERGQRPVTPADPL